MNQKDYPLKSDNINSFSNQIEKLFQNASTHTPNWKKENLGLGQSTII